VKEVASLYQYDNKDNNIYAWIDFRIYHIFKDDLKANKKIIELASKKFNYPVVYFPGNLPYKKNIVDFVNWRFLGGFFILDKENINKLSNETTNILQNLDTLTWEVNIWAILEFNNKFDFGWYFADHNELIIL
jgi:hypothetical protein